MLLKAIFAQPSFSARDERSQVGAHYPSLEYLTTIGDIGKNKTQKTKKKEEKKKQDKTHTIPSICTCSRNYHTTPNKKMRENWRKKNRRQCEIPQSNIRKSDELGDTS